MALQESLNSPMTGVAWPATRDNRLLRNFVLILAGSLLLTASAKVQIPFFPVPITMQTFFVLVIGMAYGWQLGATTVVFYLVQGAFGLPVFAGTPGQGLGLAYMLGGTGGYLLGFVFAAGLCGWLAEHGWDRRPMSTAAAMTLGTVAIYIPGLLWLGLLYGWDKPIIAWGVTPFLVGDVFKVVIGTCVLPLIWRFIKNRP